MHKEKPLQTFLLYHAVAALFFFSWYLEPGSRVWQVIDHSVFRFLNGSLTDSPVMQVFWALANLKISDLFGALFMTSFSLLWVFDAPKELRPARIAQFIYLLIWFEAGILLLKELIFPYLVSINFLRDSPSIVHSGSVMLSESMGWLKVKDSSRWSFPGDHALIIFQWASFMALFSGYRLGILAFLSSCLFIMPRLIAGAHWLSDALCGSLPLALCIVAWATCTPLYPLILPYLTRLSTLFFIQKPKGTLHAKKLSAPV